MRSGWFGFAIALMLPVAAAAQGGGSQVALAMYQGSSYDAAANCLMKQMSSARIAAWPLVYAPPRTEAVVNLWPRGGETGAPVGVFQVRQDQTGTITISFEETQRGRLAPLARAAAQRCARG
jgi:predicted anti-sigma-YlaC factor YlaD